MDPSDVETVFVAGASGGTGQHVLRLLGPRVPTVRALTRSRRKRKDLRAAGADEVVVDDLLDSRDLTGALADTFDLFIGPVQRAKAEAEAAIRAAPVRHTILRPGALTNGPRTDDVTVAEPGAKLYGAVSRADVARLLAAAPVTDRAADATVEVVATPSFPDRAVAVDWRLPTGDRDGDAVPVDVVSDSEG